MNHLEANIKGLCEKFGLSYFDFLNDLNVEHAKELSIFDLEAIADEYDVDLEALLFKPTFISRQLSDKLEKIKLLILDVDGVMTDGGMYFAESGEQMKKFNTKDGMAIIHLTRNQFQVAIISSGFRGEAVKNRAEMLGIQHCHVTREPKMDVLNRICSDLAIDLSQVAMIGDDINDLEVMRSIGVSFAPRNAVSVVKKQVDIVLEKRGGEGCVRELIDHYLLKQPLEK
ncbi:MAG: 3-deoxy-D-manno-octulosonate 8-phosphate phosphatase [Bacteroidetes bacterium]|nr:MAG: 3-deoxy-D-manno-octulosonate 8-phosphate phosphatase [Bacteroidota bacterium]